MTPSVSGQASGTSTLPGIAQTGTPSPPRTRKISAYCAATASATAAAGSVNRAQERSSRPSTCARGAPIRRIRPNSAATSGPSSREMIPLVGSR
ncbi:hypothetical protein HX744_04035 [Pseudonocardia sp. ICBG1122]|nr:hypothetical protein [Pseudonocardia pini]